MHILSWWQWKLWQLLGPEYLHSNIIRQYQFVSTTVFIPPFSLITIFSSMFLTVLNFIHIKTFCTLDGVKCSIVHLRSLSSKTCIVNGCIFSSCRGRVFNRNLGCCRYLLSMSLRLYIFKHDQIFRSGWEGWCYSQKSLNVVFQ